MLLFEAQIYRLQDGTRHMPSRAAYLTPTGESGWGTEETRDLRRELIQIDSNVNLGTVTGSRQFP